MHAKAHFVLDRFHMHKYIISATSHLKDSAQDARREIYRAIKGKRKWAAEAAFDKNLNGTQSVKPGPGQGSQQRIISLLTGQGLWNL